MRSIILSNYISRLVSIALSILMVPLYVDRLGVTNYGLVGLFLSLQQVIMLLETGIGGAVGRILIDYRARGIGLIKSKSVVNTAESIFVSIALAICVVAGIGAACLPAQITAGLNQLLSPTLLSIMLAAIGVRFPVQCYSNVLVGNDRQVLFNVLLTLTEIIRHGIGLVSIYAFPATPFTFFTSQLIAGFVASLLFRVCSMRPYAGVQGETLFSIQEVRKLLPFAGTMFGVTISWVLITNVDKPLFSSTLSAYEFGIYSIASQLGLAVFSLFYPLFNSFYPRLTHAVLSKNPAASAALLVPASALTTVAATALVATYWLFGPEFVALFLQNKAEAAKVAPLLLPFVIAAAAHGVWLIPYALQLSQGQARLVITFNIASTIALVPIIPAILRTYDAITAAWVWSSIFIVYGGVIGPLTVYRHQRNIFWQWATYGSAYPVASILLMTLILKHVLSHQEIPSDYLKLTVYSLCGLALLVTGVMSNPFARRFVGFR